MTSTEAPDGADKQSANPNEEHQRYIEFAWALNELMIDLKTPVDIYSLITDELPKLQENGLIDLVREQPAAAQQMSLNRFIVFPIINSLCKLLELCRAYGKELNALGKDVAKPLQDINRSTETRNVYEFRNTYTAHILRRGGGRASPLTLQESLDALERVTEIERKGMLFHSGGLKIYLRWVYSKGEPCVVNAIYNVIVAIEQQIVRIPERKSDD